MNSLIHWMFQTWANELIERQERLHDWKQTIDMKRQSYGRIVTGPQPNQTVVFQIKERA